MRRRLRTRRVSASQCQESGPAEAGYQRGAVAAHKGTLWHTPSPRTASAFDTSSPVWCLDMVLPVVTVAIPAEVAPAEQQVLLEACDRAYFAGSCQPFGAGVDSDLVAELHWVSEHEASVAIGLSSWLENRWVRRRLIFQREDVPAERYRSLGFALGSLAGTVVEVAQLEAEARQEEATNAEEDEESLDLPEPLDVPTPTTRSFEDLPDEVSQTTFPDAVRPRLWLGFASAPGLGQPRWGGVLGFGFDLTNGWSFDVSGAYHLQTENSSGISLRTAVSTLAVGWGFSLSPIWLSAQIGPQLTWLSPEFDSSGDAQNSYRLGACASIRAEVADWRFSPFLSAEVAYVSPLDIAVDSVKRDEYGPALFEGRTGLRIRF